MEYRGYPLARIQQDVGKEFGEITFNYTHFHVYREMSSDSEHRLEVLGSSGFEQTNFDIEIQVSQCGGVLSTMWLTLVYNAQVFERELMERMGWYYVRACEQMLEGLDREHQEQTLLSAEEVEQLLAGWNETGADYRRERCLHELFEEQVGRRPRAVAVVYEGRQVNYEELNGRANQLGHYLRRNRGVGAGHAGGVVRGAVGGDGGGDFGGAEGGRRVCAA